MLSLEYLSGSTTLQANNTYLHFSIGNHKTTSIFEYIYTLIYGGPAFIVTQGGSKYFLSLIDDYSRKIMIFLLKHKFETFKKF